jgi:HK97 family phage portal protein
MGFFRRAPTLAEVAEDRSLSRQSLPPVLAPAQASAASINARSSLGLADVFSCVRALVDAAICCPIGAWRDTDSGRVPLTGGLGPNLLRRPAPGVTQSALVAALVQNLALFGECFIGKVRDDAGNVIQLESLPAERMVVKLVASEPVYTYFSPLNGPFDNLTTADVIHVKGMLSPDGLRGASPIGLCKETVGLNADLTTSSAALWANGAIPAGVLRVAAGPNAQDAVGDLKAAWSARHQGPENRGRIAVVTGEVDFLPVSLPLTDAEFIATKHLSTAEVARIFRVPVSVIGGTTGDSVTYKNAVGEAEILVKFGLAPMLRLIEEAIGLDTDLLPGQLTGVTFDVDSLLLRPDPASRAAVTIQLVAAGLLTVDEARAQEGRPPLPSGYVPPMAPAAAAEGAGLAKAGLRTGIGEGA